MAGDDGGGRLPFPSPRRPHTKSEDSSAADWCLQVLRLRGRRSAGRLPIRVAPFHV